MNSTGKMLDSERLMLAYIDRIDAAILRSVGSDRRQSYEDQVSKVAGTLGNDKDFMAALPSIYPDNAADVDGNGLRKRLLDDIHKRFHSLESDRSLSGDTTGGYQLTSQGKQEARRSRTPFSLSQGAAR